MSHELFTDAPLSYAQRQALVAMQAEIVKSRATIKTLQARIAELEQNAEDKSILTRPEFNREVARMLAFDERYGGTSSILYFDIANLDNIVKTLGVQSAEEASLLIATTLTGYVRKSDIVGRLAPAEFGVLMIRCPNNEAWVKGRAVAAQLTKALQQIDNNRFGLEVSFGAYTFGEKDNVAKGLKEAASCLTRTDKLTQ